MELLVEVQLLHPEHVVQAPTPPWLDVPFPQGEQVMVLLLNP